MNCQLLINNITLDSEPSITLLGMEIDNSLTFNTHIGNLCKKAASQLNVLKCLSRFMGYNERQIIMQSLFILSNFNYCALIWHFCSKSNTAKIEKVQERALRETHKSIFQHITSNGRYLQTPPPHLSITSTDKN